MRLQTLIYQGIFWRGLYYASVFLLNIVIARIFKAGDSGVINAVINIVSFLLLLTSISLESSLAYFSSRNEIGRGKLTGTAMLFAAGSAFLTTLLLFLYLFIKGQLLQYHLLIIFGYTVGVVLTNYFLSLFYSVHRVLFPNVVLITINALVLLFALYEFNTLAGTDDERLFLIVYLLSFFAQGLILCLTWIATGPGSPRISLPVRYERNKLLDYAFVALLANVIFFLVYRVDYWFVQWFCTEAALGNYIQVSKLGQIFLLLPSIIATAVFTRTAGGDPEQIAKAIQIISRWLLVLYLTFVAFVALTGKWLFPAVYGPSFDQMYGPFLLLSPGILSLSTLSLLTAFYAGRNKIHINIAGSAIALAVIVFGNMLVIPWYGIYGAAAVSSIGYICFQLYVLNRFRKEYRSNVMEFFVPKLSDWNRVKQFVRGNEEN